MAKTLSSFMAQLETAAASHEDAAEFWSTCSLCFAIWAGAKRGFIPAPEWDPRVNPNLMPLYQGKRKFGEALVNEINARAFA